RPISTPWSCAKARTSRDACSDSCSEPSAGVSSRRPSGTPSRRSKPATARLACKAPELVQVAEGGGSDLSAARYCDARHPARAPVLLPERGEKTPARLSGDTRVACAKARQDLVVPDLHQRVVDRRVGILRRPGRPVVGAQRRVEGACNELAERR